ncbi:unnamed protein product [Acanthoscelides obtectus]|uniref:Uncharacterized protein n=1 Tax=Acanthoscelides obtectus TaxID=200917 RepID=A0A9P0M3N2_ACAOB|nr:unnamed protein product [Acanthoscelides obtectus]CAK1670204.1 hypothetical protein AOBTE_LOCUS27471 [Acanthoscelides obtectus]
MAIAMPLSEVCGQQSLIWRQKQTSKRMPPVESEEERSSVGHQKTAKEDVEYATISVQTQGRDTQSSMRSTGATGGGRARPCTMVPNSNMSPSPSI